MRTTTSQSSRIVSSQGHAARVKFDFATILALTSGFGLLVVAIFLGGTPQSFFDVPSILVVIGGTVCIIVASYGFVESGRTVSATVMMFMRHVTQVSRAVESCMVMAVTARKQGILTLQNHVDKMEGQLLLRQGLEMVIDGMNLEEISHVLNNELVSLNTRQTNAAKIMYRAAAVSPAMGLIGTLIGLVQMLGSLDDPSSIGPAMAIALLTTFYGAILSNMFFSPLASRLEHSGADEALVNQIYAMTVISVARQENPRRLEMLINSLLPPTKRIRYFE